MHTNIVSAASHTSFYTTAGLSDAVTGRTSFQRILLTRRRRRPAPPAAQSTTTELQVGSTLWRQTCRDLDLHTRGAKVHPHEKKQRKEKGERGGVAVEGAGS